MTNQNSFKLKQIEADFIVGILNSYSTFVKREPLGSPNAVFTFPSGNKVTIALGIIIVEVWNPTLQARMRTDYRDSYRFFADYNGEQKSPFKGIEAALKKIIGI